MKEKAILFFETCVYNGLLESSLEFLISIIITSLHGAVHQIIMLASTGVGRDVGAKM